MENANESSAHLQKAQENNDARNVQQLVQENAQLKTNLAKLKDKVINASKIIAICSRQEQDLEAKKQECAQIKQTVTLLNEQLLEQSKKQQDIKALQLKEIAYQLDIKRLKETCQSQMNEISKLNSKNEELASKIEDISQEKEFCDAQLEQLKQERDSALAKISEFQSNNGNKSIANNTNNSSNQANSSTIPEFVAMLTKLQDSNEQKNQSITRLEAEKAKLQAQLQAQSSELVQFKSKNATLEKDLQTAKSQVEQKNNEIIKLMAASKNVAASLPILNATPASSSGTNSMDGSLREENQKLLAKVAKLKGKLENYKNVMNNIGGLSHQIFNLCNNGETLIVTPPPRKNKKRSSSNMSAIDDIVAQSSIPEPIHESSIVPVYHAPPPSVPLAAIASNTPTSNAAPPPPKPVINSPSPAIQPLPLPPAPKHKLPSQKQKKKAVVEQPVKPVKPMVPFHDNNAPSEPSKPVAEKRKIQEVEPTAEPPEKRQRLVASAEQASNSQQVIPSIAASSSSAPNVPIEALEETLDVTKLDSEEEHEFAKRIIFAIAYANSSLRTKFKFLLDSATKFWEQIKMQNMKTFSESMCEALVELIQKQVPNFNFVLQFVCALQTTAPRNVNLFERFHNILARCIAGVAAHDAQFCVTLASIVSALSNCHRLLTLKHDKGSNDMKKAIQLRHLLASTCIDLLCYPRKLSLHLSIVNAILASNEQVLASEAQFENNLHNNGVNENDVTAATRALYQTMYHVIQYLLMAPQNRCEIIGVDPIDKETVLKLRQTAHMLKARNQFSSLKAMSIDELAKWLLSQKECILVISGAKQQNKCEQDSSSSDTSSQEAVGSTPIPNQQLASSANLKDDHQKFDHSTSEYLLALAFKFVAAYSSVQYTFETLFSDYIWPLLPAGDLPTRNFVFCVTGLITDVIVADLKVSNRLDKSIQKLTTEALEKIQDKLLLLLEPNMYKHFTVTQQILAASSLASMLGTNGDNSRCLAKLILFFEAKQGELQAMKQVLPSKLNVLYDGYRRTQHLTSK